MKTIADLKILNQFKNNSNEDSFENYEERGFFSKEKIKRVFPEPLKININELRYSLGEEVVQGYVLPKRNIPEGANGIIISRDDSKTSYEKNGDICFPAIYCKLKKLILK